jgi:sugar-specific transcriptional regulator TrmB
MNLRLTCRSHNDRLNLITSNSASPLLQRGYRYVLPISDEDVDLLSCLGLTNREARVYLALLLAGESKAEAISKISLVHRQEVYRVVASLQEKGLVEVKLSSPTVFRSVPAEAAFKMLIGKKTKELSAIGFKARRFERRHNHDNSEISQTANEPHFTLLSGSDCCRRLVIALENAKWGVDMIITNKRLHQFSNRVFETKSVQKILKEAVSFRVIISNPEEAKLPRWLSLLQDRLTNITVKTVSNGSLPHDLVGLKIVDNKEVFIVVNSADDFNHSFYLWSDSDCLVSLCRSHFECVWASLTS